MKEIKKTTLPFLEIRKIVNLKGRDLLWRLALKALPKIHNAPCIWCNEQETSEHIFFKCKSHIKETQECINYIQEKSGGSRINWGIEIFNRLDIPLTANAIAIICENIWRRRNKKIHNTQKLKKTTKENSNSSLGKNKKQHIETNQTRKKSNQQRTNKII
ncbi:hypothetical protein DDB_G0282541 [Dictyostelium discoideum AX4]|uniref:Reverse transcriptase zinc-binding domain-containing protein n=1 Tax=Dictyostelium discoideum TaxID=44689 RepID=Q54SC8_DICDI|nr:hypothetical protein DDB_G0282541 [Dictyostelium discoideum AX4]EAL66130.1 hypothetical protein DDB_G0282541 [Dictyostelium discoideum AX4]|eukprot:XP_640111.1 hypothetical protein DDB_G0282541 [Dictyostelium discoideum AX4]